MDKTQTIIFAALIAVAAVRIYQKYIKKNNKPGSENNPSSGNTITHDTKEEDYEPYSKK
jgi:hypothetical protein